MKVWLRTSYFAELLKGLPLDSSLCAFLNWSLVPALSSNNLYVSSFHLLTISHSLGIHLPFPVSADNSLSQTTIISYLDYSKGLFIVTRTEPHTHLTILHTTVMGIILKYKTCHFPV